MCHETGAKSRDQSVQITGIQFELFEIEYL